MSKTTNLLICAFGIWKKDGSIHGPCSMVGTCQGTRQQWNFLESEGYVTRNTPFLHPFCYSITDKGAQLFKSEKSKLEICSRVIA
jgi:hypothetical protein